MSKIFNKDASNSEFDLLIESLCELTTYGINSEGCNLDQADKRLKELQKKRSISEEEFLEIADDVDVFWDEATPGRLTIPEIRSIWQRVSKFQTMAAILSKYGYSEADIVREVANTEMNHYDWLERIKNSTEMRGIKNLPAELWQDDHFIMGLVRVSRPKIYHDLLSTDKKKDADIAIQYLLGEIVSALGAEYSGLFEGIPDTLRYDQNFLLQLKDRVVTQFGKNVIDPLNFGYLLKDPKLFPAQVKELQFWIDFYDGDMKKVFLVACQLNIVPMKTLLNDVLTRPDASEFYNRLPMDLKLEAWLSRIALKSDPLTVLWLPEGSPLMQDAKTWFILLDVYDTDKRYKPDKTPRLPAALLNNTDLVNRIASTHPDIFGSLIGEYRHSGQLISQLTAQSMPRFIAEHPEFYGWLREDQKNMELAKGILKHSVHLREELIEAYGIELSIHSLQQDPWAWIHFPEELASRPDVADAVLGKIYEHKEKKVPYWIQKYFSRYPEKIPSIIDKRPEWLGSHDFLATPEVFKTVSDRFHDLIITPDRLIAFLTACNDQMKYDKTIDKTVFQTSFIIALRSYSGDVNHKLRKKVEDILRDIGIDLNEEDTDMLIGKYGAIPAGLSSERVSAALKNADDDSLIRVLKSNHNLPAKCIGFIAHRLKGRKERLYAAVTEEPRILKMLDDDDWSRLGPYIQGELEADLNQLAKLYSLLPERMRGVKSLAMKATLVDEDNFYYIPKFLLENENFMIELCGWGAVRPKNLNSLAPMAQAAAVARKPFFLHMVHSSLRNNPEFIDACLERNIWIFLELTAKEKETTWPRFKAKLARHGFEQQDVASWRDFIKILKKKISFPMRIRNIAAWKRIAPGLFAAGRRSDGENGHRSLVIISKNDWNTAFQSVPLVDRLDSMGIDRIDFIEVGSKKELKAALKKIRVSRVRYDDITLGGHGTRDTIALGGADRRVNAVSPIVDDDYIVFSDFGDPEMDLSGILKDDGRLVLLSCSNGEGAEKEDNIANRYAATLYTGQIVISSQVPTNIDYMDMDSDGHLNIYWDGAKPYIVRGRKN